MELKIHELAAMAGISVRALQYYDKIGLLKPKKHPENGYRVYTQKEVDRLQEILLLKGLGFPLKDIEDLLNASDYDRLEALKLHRSLIKRRLEEIRLLADTINQSIKEMEEGKQMKHEDKFKGINFRENPYEQEARDRWGSEKVDEANAHIKSRSDAELKTMQERMNAVFSEFAALRGTDPSSVAAVNVSERFYRLLNDEIGSFYNKEVFKGLGQMYIDDERFTKNLDKWGEGTALFMRDAMANFSDNCL